MPGLIPWALPASGVALEKPPKLVDAAESYREKGFDEHQTFARTALDHARPLDPKAFARWIDEEIAPPLERSWNQKADFAIAYDRACVAALRVGTSVGDVSLWEDRAKVAVETFALNLLAQHPVEAADWLAYLEADTDFAAVREKPWFNEAVTFLRKRSERVEVVEVRWLGGKGTRYIMSCIYSGNGSRSLTPEPIADRW